MTTLRPVLGDQCSLDLASLRDLQPRDVVLMAEVQAECTYVRHHQRKIAFVLSAMRHFAETLRGRGVRVDYIVLDDPDNTHSLRGEILRAAARHKVARIVVTEPGEWRLLTDMQAWHTAEMELDIRADTRFVCSSDSFRSWASGKRSLRMEHFYREMRRRHGVLLDAEGEPEGGRWNFDAENRKRLPPGLRPPSPPTFPPDRITTEVLTLVGARFGEHFGSLDGFAMAVTAADAEALLADFLARRLAHFGDWQDAMQSGQTTLFHSLISAALNVGLLSPLAICRAAEEAYRSGQAPLNAAEGFIRQILGWREFMRGIYWLHMPDYGQLNALQADRALPWFYWTGETRMNCMAKAIGQTRDIAYAHHIQRLMVTGNFALLAGIAPDEVDDWYMTVYVDAYQWVEMPNTRGMALYADGGIVGSKPYASSGAYINRMSDYCRDCHYDVGDATGPRACPFNALYWDFIARHERRFAGNPRMAMPVRSWARMTPARQHALRAAASRFLAAMDAGEGV